MVICIFWCVVNTDLQVRRSPATVDLTTGYVVVISIGTVLMIISKCLIQHSRLHSYILLFFVVCFIRYAFH